MVIGGLFVCFFGRRGGGIDTKRANEGERVKGGAVNRVGVFVFGLE